MLIKSFISVPEAIETLSWKGALRAPLFKNFLCSEKIIKDINELPHLCIAAEPTRSDANGL